MVENAERPEERAGAARVAGDDAGTGAGAGGDRGSGGGGSGAGAGGGSPGGGGLRLPPGLADLVLFVPRLAVLLGRLIADAQVASTDKLLLVAVVAYIWSPIDIVPDFVPMIGQLDDVYLVALCLLRLMNRSGADKVRQYWEGPEDIVAFLNTVTDLATRYLPEPARLALRGWIDARDPTPPRT